MNPSQYGMGTALAAYGALFNSGTLKGYDGNKPVTPETALSGNTLRLTATYATTAFGTPTYTSGSMVAAASFSGTPTLSDGLVTFFRATDSGGTHVLGDFTVGSAWLPSNVTAPGQYCTNGGNTYVCASVTGDAKTDTSGGPSGTGSGITDNHVTWNYVGPGQLFDVLMGNCNVVATAPIGSSITLVLAQSLSIPAV